MTKEKPRCARIEVPDLTQPLIKPSQPPTLFRMFSIHYFVITFLAQFARFIRWLEYCLCCSLVGVEGLKVLCDGEGLTSGAIDIEL